MSNPVVPIAASVLQPSEVPKIAPSTHKLKLDLGCGAHPAEGFEGVDLLAPKAKHRVDLFKFPWPWEENSVAELHASHFVEHIPARDVEERDLSEWLWRLGQEDAREQLLGKDMAFAFFDEAFRVLVPGGKFSVIVPALSGDRAFQDPTHRRFIPAQWFTYFDAEWRQKMELQHYRAVCDFAVQIRHTVSPEMNLLPPEHAERRYREGRNTIWDFHADLVSRKRTA